MGSSSVVEVPLRFSLSSDNLGNLLIEVLGLLGGEWIRIPNPLELFRSGFIFRMNGATYGVSKRSLESLLAIGALKPQIAKDGRLVANVSPSILKYLRTKEGMSEDPSSKRIEILEQTPEPRARISYHPDEGLRIRTGYEIPGHSELVSLGAMQPTPEKTYARIGQAYLPMPSAVDPKVAEWLKGGERVVPLEDIPEFFTRDLVLLRSNFKAVLDDKAFRKLRGSTFGSTNSIGLRRMNN